MSKKKDARQVRIREILLSESKVRISELAKRLDVTPETLRNDLNEMEQQSMIIREHGYARIVNSFSEIPVFMRSQEHSEEKKRAAIRAFQEIKDGDVVFIDSGSTTLYGLPALQMKKDIIIVTNSLPLAQQCAPLNFDILFTGGMVFNVGLRTYGHFAAQVIDSLQIDTAIMGTDGLVDAEGFTTINVDELSIKRQVINHSKNIICIADKYKFETRAPYTFCKFREFDTLVTNKLTDAQREMVKDIKNIIEV
jgi:DeoR/GlpR family transcriptional regulator of sugar metabolism